MPISNKVFKEFGINNTETVGAFKSVDPGVSGSFIPSTDLDVMQSSEYVNGFLNSDIATVEDISSVLAAESQKTGLIQQIGGITIYNSGISFYQDAICRDPANPGQLYKSLINNNVGNALTDLTKWVAIANIYTIPTSTLTRYAVNSAPLTSGASTPNYITGSGTNILSFQNISSTNPLIQTYSDGTSRTFTSNFSNTSVAGFANGTYCVLFNESTLSLAFPLLSNVLEVNALPVSVTNGQYICVVSPLQTYFGSGGNWVATNFVKFAELTVAGGIIGTITQYSLNGIARLSNQLVTTNANTTYNHNLGTVNCTIEGFYDNITGSLGGGIVNGSNGFLIPKAGLVDITGNYYTSTLRIADNKTFVLRTGNGGIYHDPVNSAIFTGATARFTIKRDF